MLGYVYYGTNDLLAAIAFYEAVLTPLGMSRVVTNDSAWDAVAAGWGRYDKDKKEELAFWVGLPFDGNPASVGNGSMVAFHGKSREAIDDFHAAALARGGCCEGPPGLRPQYGPDFYVAYVRDPDGNKLAAVFWGGDDGARVPRVIDPWRAWAEPIYIP